MKYRHAWLDYYLINLTDQEDKFYTNNWFGEIIIKLNKKKVRPFANVKPDIFLRKTIRLNVMSLWKGEKVLIYEVIWATRHRNGYLGIDIYFDVIFIIKLI